MRNAPTLLLIVSLLVAGCGGDKKANAEPTPSADANQLPPGVTNILEGIVKTVDFLPIEGANVTLAGTELFNVTDAQGYYVFESLPPRDYILKAAKEGYRDRTQRAIIEDDKIFQLDFVLEDIPLEKPYHDTDDWIGFISCQAAYQTSPDTTARPQCGEQDPNNDQSEIFEVLPGAAQVVVEAEWTRTTDAAKILTMTLEGVGEGGIVYAHDRGESGMKLVISQTLIRLSIPQGGAVRVVVESSPSIVGDESGFDFGLALQQSFKVYFTVFYVEPGPHSFTAIPE